MSKMPSIIRKTLVKRPILVDEDPAAYRELFEAISNDERSQSLREWLLVADIVNVTWVDPAAKLRIEKLLEPHGLTLDGVVASGFGRKISVQISTDRLLETAYRRRNALYQDLERVRSKSRRIDN